MELTPTQVRDEMVRQSAFLKRTISDLDAKIVEKNATLASIELEIAAATAKRDYILSSEIDSVRKSMKAIREAIG